jgi:hypothetical protein
MSQLMSYSAWRKAVDVKVDAISGLSSDDLADIPYRNMYDDEISADDTAIEALEHSDYPVELLF